MNTETYNTFWKIIKENRIEIPTIQRDYAYGRKSAISIMQKFITDIFDCLNENKPLNLDFIYGKLLGKENQISLERNRNNIQSLLKTIKTYASDLNIEVAYDLTKQNNITQTNITFIPLDGQQRLTTLYLVHWYVAQRNKDINALDVLKRFSYSTRISSKDFCQMLTTNIFNIESSIKSVADLISNHEDYFSYWQKDPTVKSMLLVVDEIHKRFNVKLFNYVECWKRLTYSDCITFDFFDLDDFELTDELYIKMNARGKHLTHYENYKAWLIKDYQDQIFIENWKTKFDIQWNDLFWRVKEKSEHTVDSEYMQFFKILFLGDYIKTLVIDGSGMNDDSALENYETEILNLSDFKSVIGVLRKKDSNPIPIFENGSLFAQNISDYLIFLDLFSLDLIRGLDNRFQKIIRKYISTEFSKLIFGEKLNKLSWWDTTLHYAISRYLIKIQTINSNFDQWLRIISNLIYNSKIDSPKLFIESINSIDNLIEKIDPQLSIYHIFSNLNEKEILFFSPNQKNEEILKSKLIEAGSEWANLLIEAENHSYFYGQIGFILKLSENENKIDIGSFKDNYQKVSVLFSEEVLNDTTNILTRSFLTQGDCLYNEGDNKVFNSNIRGTLRNRNENWRKFFEHKLSFITKIIEHPNFRSNEILKSLNDIIEVELKNLNETFIAKLVENPSLFEYAKKRCIRKFGNGYYLLNSTRISGYFAELFTYDWYLKNKHEYAIKNPGTKISYQFEKGQENEAFIRFNYNGKENRIERNYGTGKYVLNDDLLNTYNTIEEAITSKNALS